MKKLKLNLNGETITSTNLFSVNKDWHDDIHYLKFASDNQSIWMAHDGGIAKGIPIEETDDSMIFNWQNYYSGLGVSNLYNMASSESKPTNLLYGAQDTGCNIKIGTNNWKEVNLGDGYAVKFHPSYPNISFVSSQNYFRGSHMTEELYMVLWLLFAAGVWYSYKEYGKQQYANGMTDAISMHSDGLLEYEIVRDKKGNNDIEIRIKGD